MCTLSWLKTNTGFEVFFNRDEQRTRLIASLPECYKTTSGNQYIMPTDLNSGGSWIGVTDSGVGICLLNFYQGITPSTELISRGLLVKDLLGLSKADKVLDHIKHLNCQHYAPFTLVIFNPEQHHPISFCWDGVQLTDLIIESPYTSSGVEFPQVSQARQETFRQYFQDKQACIEQLKAYHSSHYPEKSKWSVCMHREDACTVSFSHMSIQEFSSSFHYIDGSPCQKSAKTASISLSRNSLMSETA
ncbi:hypothetical protein MED121_07115 [Marinomonas sp. MED121]|uniref:NRDE family protein n=1 Tax=Marinomonas sp. MED121 TaxID=314277 RepID=UPI0000690386|nr:NRDE family protein [Marinomonas sp. MED121]EAQ66434.1 hypothetical protein MED121_07115 [Marinomonas sp. MED121]